MDAHAEDVIEVERSKAATGAVHTVTLAGGRPVTVNVPPGVKEGTLLRLPRQGPGGADAFVRVRLTRPAGPWRAMLGSRGARVALVAAAAVVVAGVAVGVAVRAQHSTDGTAQPAAEPQLSASVVADPLGDLRDRDCLHNEGTDSEPVMDRAACTSGNYRVLSRHPGTVDDAICDLEAGTTHSYVSKSYWVYSTGVKTLNTAQSSVLCLEQVG
ncbi:hypothetical protein Dvina_25240 [Dactylosporangium vinaceum]|uniref:Serine/threonine protein kinase n=1 Tax=Dactylosporangium vinaceum TaxID=53362 RepID=A0ABV5MDR5_9ACTN|nr:hypothetical protein [Dactylosporangium vinaceum]UAC01066.1 hypothetical protein Dvina_25240 [Dactylosporangium vinaceum]